MDETIFNDLIRVYQHNDAMFCNKGLILCLKVIYIFFRHQVEPGKSSLIAALLEKNDGSRKMVSISHTTRAPRPRGNRRCALLFVSVDEFEELIEKGHF